MKRMLSIGVRFDIMVPIVLQHLIVRVVVEGEREKFLHHPFVRKRRRKEGVCNRISLPSLFPSFLHSLTRCTVCARRKILITKRVYDADYCGCTLFGMSTCWNPFLPLSHRQNDKRSRHIQWLERRNEWLSGACLHYLHMIFEIYAQY